MCWEKVAAGGFWADAVAAVEAAPLGGALHRVVDPKNWQWYLPEYEELATNTEMLAAIAWRLGGAKASNKPKRRKRPWDEDTTSRKLDMAVRPIEAVADDFASRFAYDINTG